MRQAALGPGSLTLCGLYEGNYVHFKFEALIFGWMLFSWNTNIRGSGCQKALRIIRAVLSNWAPGLELLSVSGSGFESSFSSQTPHGESSRGSSVCMACRKLSASLVLWMKWKWWIKMGVYSFMCLVFESLSLALPYGGAWMVRTGRGSVTLLPVWLSKCRQCF